MSEQKLLERLAVLFDKTGVHETIAEDLYVTDSLDTMHEWNLLMLELEQYLPSQPAPDAPKQMELGSDIPTLGITAEEVYRGLMGE